MGNKTWSLHCRNLFFLSGKLILSSWIILISMTGMEISYAQALNIPTEHYGISIGNSKRFNGLRLNFRDHDVEILNGVNITLWKSKVNQSATVNGLSLGVMPDAGYLRGIQVGIGMKGEVEVRGVTLGVVGAASGKILCGLGAGGLGIAAGNELKGIMLGGLGAASGGDISGIAAGGLGVGAGEDITGIIVGGLGAGAGGNLTGISVGGLGVGASGNLKGFSFGILGVGAGEDIDGIVIGGLGAAAGEDIKGITIGGLGTAAGKNYTGIGIGLLGVAAGNTLKGIALGGLGTAAQRIEGVAIGGVGVGATHNRGVTVALLIHKISDDGTFKGLSVSASNHIKGHQTGLSVGLFNYARQLTGIQIGLINYVRDNPKYLKILPVFNFHFE